MSHITRKRGDTYAISILVTENEVALNVTGCTFLLTVDPAETPLDASNNICQLAGVVTNGPAGVVSFTPTENDMDHVGKYYYDIQMTDLSGAKRTIAASSFKLIQDITKA